MKLTLHLLPGLPTAKLLTAGALAILAGLSSARGQTSIYTLDGGAAAQSGQTYAATAADESGVYVFNSGELTLASPTVTKTGGASNLSNSSARGVNAGILARSAGMVTITGGSVNTNASGANGIFATGVDSIVRMTDGTITTSGSNSSGVDVTYGGEAFLAGVNVTTQQSASPALSMDFGGGSITATGGTFVTAGNMSPAIYSLGTVAVTGAIFTARGGSGAVIDGANAISLTGCSLTALLNAAELTQTAAGTGGATFTVNGGSLNAFAGDLFFLAAQSGPLTAAITLEGAATVSTGSGYLVDATSNSTANFVADGETLGGNFMTDRTSTIAVTLQNGTTLTGHVNAGGLGKDSLSTDATSTWIVNGASILSSLTNAGTLAFTGEGGTVDVSGVYRQGATGKLLVVLDGAAAGANYGQLAVTGKAVLAGTLEVNAASGFTPQVGETFNLVTYGKEIGAFSTLASSSGLTYNVSYGAKEATITITSVSSVKGVPTIIGQPNSVKTDPGASVIFSVAAVGVGPLTYQWYNDAGAIFGATGASYTIPEVNGADAGNYHVVVTNAIGGVTSAVAVLKIRATTNTVPVVTIAALGDGEIVQGGENGKALISRTGNTTAAMNVYYRLTGAAVNGFDYVGTNGAALSGEIEIPAGAASAKLKIAATSGAKAAPIEAVKVVLMASPAADYTVGTADKAKLQLIAND